MNGSKFKSSIEDTECAQALLQLARGTVDFSPEKVSSNILLYLLNIFHDYIFIGKFVEKEKIYQSHSEKS